MSKYDPDGYDGVGAMPTLFARTANGALNQWTVWAHADKVHVKWGQLNGTLQHASFACKAKNVGRSNETTAEKQACLEAIAKWRKQLKKKYYETVEETAELNIKPMLAQSFEPRKNKVTYPVNVQRKLDGVRCLAYRKDGHVILQSRGGDPYDVEHIRAELEKVLGDDDVLDGEIYHHGVPLQDIMSLAKRPQEESKKLEYIIYDFTHLTNQDAIWVDRRKELSTWYAKWLDAPTSIRVLETYQVDGECIVRSFHDQFVAEGYEGVIVRALGGVYRFGYRSSDLLKLKNFSDDEFLIIGWTTGKGKFSNVPIFRCVTKGGKEFDVTPRGSDAVRRQMLADADEHIGKYMTVRYMGFSSEGIPKIAVGVCIREPGV